MAFSSCLKGYLEDAGCSAQELADAAQISASSMSRYLSGERTPNYGSNVIPKLSVAIAARTSHEAKQVEANLRAAACAGAADYAAFSENLRNVMGTFGIANNRLARHMGFDPSYISRILAGQRRPADLPSFVNSVATYIARHNFDEAGKQKTAALADVAPDTLSDPDALASAIREYLGSDLASSDHPSSLGAFLEKLDEFDLNDYVPDAVFSTENMPAASARPPDSKTYSGIAQMKQAELDFLEAAANDPSTGNVIMYSDMPLGEMAADREFVSNVMVGLAKLVRKGVRLSSIHDVHRPFDELLMGLEGWIPLYMTGLVSPFYLPQPTSAAFLHFLRSAESVAASGEGIAGNQDAGRYMVTKDPDDVTYLRERATDLLGLARPLMRVYREGDSLQRTLDELEAKTSSAPVEVGRNVFKNLHITVHPNAYALIEKENPPAISFLIEYPALVDALEHYEATLF